jgi:3-methyladenine DNA glycosylase Mpg
MLTGNSCSIRVVDLRAGIDQCANVVTGAADSGQAVVVGAIEPVDGLDVMEARQSVRWNEQVCGDLPGEASAS